MKPILTSYCLCNFLIIGSVNPSLAQTPEQLYQKGLTKEEGEGALQDAISLYTQVADNSNASVSLQAKALLHIGMCFEKLGTKEAVKAYQRLVTDFPTQKTEVAYARERLTKLNPGTEKVLETTLKPKYARIRIPTKLSSAVRLSPDGKNLSLISDSKIWVMPLSGNLGPDIPGKPVQVNTEGIDAEYTDLSWSRDGKWIAFNDPGMSGPNQKIYLVPSSGGKPREIIENYRDARIVNYRISLSPDGKKLAFSSVDDKKQHIFTISTEGGTPVQLTDMQAREPVFSPDGKMIAFVEDKNLGRGEGGLGLWITPVQGGTSHLLANANTASSPVWSPNGNMIAFIDKGNNKKINFVDVPKDLKTGGKVISIDAPENTEEVKLLAGWTPDNKIGLLLTSKREFSLYTLPAKGGQAAIVSDNCYAFQPRWSLDGKQIFYVTPPAEGDNIFYRLTLASVSASGGIGKPIVKEHDGKVIGQLPYQSGNRISPEGKVIISSAYTSSDTMGVSEWPNSKIWEISLDGKESKQITNTEGRFADMCPSWSPDGQKIAFLRAGLKDGLSVFDKVCIYTVSSSGGELKMLIPESDKYIFSPVWSPDGKMIAFLTKDKETASEAPPSRYMNVVNVENGSIRVVGEVPKAHVNIELAWSPDSRRIAFNDDNVIKVMNIDNGKIEDIKTNLVDVEIWHLDWSPDGEQFVFSGAKGGKDEFWFLENFLPFEKLAKKK